MKIEDFRRTRNMAAENGPRRPSINELARAFFNAQNLVVGYSGEIFTDATCSRSLRKGEIERFAAFLSEAES